MNTIAPSIACADLLHLGEQIEYFDAAGIAWHHIDIMDGQFVPNFCLGTDLVRAIHAHSTSKQYVHLMARRPELHIQLLQRAGADYLAFHVETTNTPFRIANQIRDAGMRPAIAVNAITPLEPLEPLLAHVDAVTLMTIEPGIVGPTFMELSYGRIEKLRKMIDRNDLNVKIEIDGGVNLENAVRCLECGADALVSGVHALFRKGQTLEEQMRQMKQILTEVGRQ